MPTRLVDLDELVGADVEVKLDGERYRLPSDCPVELWLAITAPEAQEGDERQQTLYLQDRVLELFQVRQPNLTSLPPMGLVQLKLLIQMAYIRDDGDEAEAAQARPTTRRTRGGTSKPRASKSTRARSQSKS